MPRVLPAVLLIAVVAGCGGSSKNTEPLTKAEYAAALDKLCTKAIDDASTVTLTSSMATWKKNGDEAVEIIEDEVTGFKALTAPESLREAADRLNKAGEGMVTAFEDTTEAAEEGDAAKFNKALKRQMSFLILSRTAASVLGAKACS
jgi:hypothetical protein